MRKSRRSPRSEAALYFRTVLGLLAGRHVEPIDVYSYKHPDIAGLNEAQCKLIIDEGRRQLDWQLTQLEQTRARAQFLLTTALAIAAFVVPVLGAAAAECDTLRRVAALTTTILSLVFLVSGVLGAGGVVVAKKVIDVPDVADIAGRKDVNARTVAGEYIGAAKINENTRTSSITTFRDAVLLTLAGSALWGISWAILNIR